nr:hypothetical protein CFP56_41957 [Quercus suber]
MCQGNLQKLFCIFVIWPSLRNADLLSRRVCNISCMILNSPGSVLGKRVFMGLPHAAPCLQDMNVSIEMHHSGNYCQRHIIKISNAALGTSNAHGEVEFYLTCMVPEGFMLHPFGTRI